MRLLVAGSDRVDAGKTTFAAGLVAHTDAVGFKPRAGNDVWFHHDDVRDAVEQGRLFGKDAKTLAATSPGSLEPEDINPVHRLWRPAPGPKQGLLGQEDREFLVDRMGDRYLVNGTVELPELVTENLPLGDAVVVESVDQLNRAMEQFHLPALAGLADAVGRTDRAVVESYSDIARPLSDGQPDAVAVVEPRRVRLYDGQRYWRACEVASRSPKEGRLEERVGAVVDLVEPRCVRELPALTGRQREETTHTAEAYAPAYEQLCEIAAE